MTIKVRIIETGPLQVNCLLLSREGGGEALVIDPGGDAALLLSRLQGEGLELVAILATHGHFDHIGGVAALQRATGAPFHIHPADLPLVEGAARQAAGWGFPFGDTPHFDHPLAHGQRLGLAGLELEVIHTPGHSPGGVCFRWAGGMAVGDTLFAGSVGRADLPGGDFKQLIHSIRSRLLTLPDTLACHPGHGPSTTIGRERRGNPYLTGWE